MNRLPNGLLFNFFCRYVAGNGIFIIGAHTDSPCLKLKPITKVMTVGQFLHLMPYIVRKYYMSSAGM